MLGNVVLRKSVLKPLESSFWDTRSELEKYFQSKHVLCIPICKTRLEFDPLTGKVSIVVLGKDGQPKESLEVYSAEGADREFSEFFKQFMSIQLSYCKYFYSSELR